MKSKLGIYVISLGGFDATGYLATAQPRIAVSMEHNLDTWRAIKQASPNTFVIGRYFVDDPKQFYQDDPERRAEEFFNLMRPDAEKMRGVYDAWMSYNEVDLGKDENAPERARRYSRFHVRWGDLMKQANLVSCAYSFATGNPAKGDPKDGGGVEPNLWPYLVEGLRHCDLLSLHEYSAPTMDNMQGWLCLRYRAVWNMIPPDARRPIVITECGIDGGPIGRDREGWSKFVDESKYLATLRWYDQELQKDDYVIGATIFSANAWDMAPSFGMGNLGQIRQYIAQGGAPSPVTLKLPAVPSTVSTPPSSTVSTPPAAGPGTYTIQAGDTLTKIAKKFGVTVAAIAAANNIADPSRISTGRVITIPAAASVSFGMLAAEPGPAPKSRARQLPAGKSRAPIKRKPAASAKKSSKKTSATKSKKSSRKKR